MSSLNNDITETDLPTSILHSGVSHFKQRYTWDCGLTCILMILSKSKQYYFQQNFTNICKEGNFGKSTWTIDLCFILKRFQINHKYLTATIGINSDYKNVRYYDKILAKDCVRIYRKFKTAQQNGINIEKRQNIDNKFICKHLAIYGPIILLTDGNLLLCDKCNDVSSNCLLLDFKSVFSGHYIVLIGYNERDIFYYRNPSKSDHICEMTFNDMKIARNSYGTDEDIILIFND